MSHSEDDLLWRIEEACRMAWPAAEEQVRGGWLLRRSGGTTRRTNTVNPIQALRHDVTEVLAGAAEHYGVEPQRVLFRVPTFMPHVERQLTALDFSPQAPTGTWLADVGGHAAPPRDGTAISLAAMASREWLEAKRRMTPADDAQQRAYESMVASIAAPARFAAITHDHRIVAVAYGVLARELLVLESVVVDASARRRGLGRRVVGSLMAWARSEGVGQACLQVTSDNAPALRLYGQLGFDREPYGYSYWQARSVTVRRGQTEGARRAG